MDKNRIYKCTYTHWKCNDNSQKTNQKPRRKREKNKKQKPKGEMLLVKNLTLNIYILLFNKTKLLVCQDHINTIVPSTIVSVLLQFCL